MSIPNTTHRLLVEKLGGTTAESFVGNEGEVFYDPDSPTPTLRISDGSTPGGQYVGIASTSLLEVSQANLPNITGLNLTVENISALSSAGINIGVGGYNNIVVYNNRVLIQNVPLILTVYTNTAERDSAIPTPTAGMVVYVTGVGMQVRGATSWNTISGSGT